MTARYYASAVLAMGLCPCLSVTTPYTSATLSWLRGLSVSMTLRAMLAGELSPGRVTQARQVEG